MGLTRDQILAVSDIQTEEVHVPEWGGTVLVRGLTGAERDEFEAGMATPQGNRVRYQRPLAQLWHELINSEWLFRVAPIHVGNRSRHKRGPHVLTLRAERVQVVVDYPFGELAAADAGLEFGDGAPQGEC